MGKTGLWISIAWLLNEVTTEQVEKSKYAWFPPEPDMIASAALNVSSSTNKFICEYQWMGVAN